MKARLLRSAPSLKYKAALCVALRREPAGVEVANLKVSDIDSERMTLPGRARQGAARPLRDAFAATARVVARMVARGAAAGLALSGPEPGQPHVGPPTGARRPRRGAGGRDRQARLAAYAAAQLRDPSARAERRHSGNPSPARTRQARERPRSTPGSPSTRSATSRARWSGWASASRAGRRRPDGRRMARPRLEVADVFRAHGAAWRKANAGHVSHAQLKVMSAIETCRKPPRSADMSSAARTARTGNAYACNSCRQSPLPEVPRPRRRSSNGSKNARRSFCPVPYYHVVFTLPAAIGAIAFQNKAAVYDLLFRIAAEAIITIAADPEASGRAHRPHRRPPHLGLGAEPSSPCPRHRSRRRPVAGRIALDRLQARLLPARARAVAPVPAASFSKGSQRCTRPTASSSSATSPRAQAQTRLRRPLSRRCAAQNGWSTPRGRSPDLRPSSPISPATPIAWRSLELQAHRARRGRRHLQMEGTTGSKAATGSPGP